MAAIRAEVEGRRERLVALVLLLQGATRSSPLTQETILAHLKVDEYPVVGPVPRKVPAYEGSAVAVRQKFERDKADIRDMGFQIETVSLDDGTVGYWIDPRGAYAPPLHFTDEESRVVALALRLYGFGARGAFSVFADEPAVDGGLEFSNYYTPVLHALRARRAISFGYHSSSHKTRVVEPLVIEVFHGTPYLVARVAGTDEIKGYRFSRMTTTPVVLTDTFVADEETLATARSWRPEFTRAPAPIDVVVETNETYGDLLASHYPGSPSRLQRDGRVEVTLTLDSEWAALRFVLDAADRVTLTGPKALREALRAWLKTVNRGTAPDPEEIAFPGSGGSDVLGQTLQLLHAVYLSEDGLRISELAARFSLDPALVRLIMDRLVALQPFGNRTGYLAHVIKECDDWDDEAHDDSTYRADFSDTPRGEPEPSPFLLRDLVELNVALREASRAYSDPSILSAIDKIESAVAQFVHVDSVTDEPWLAEVRAALDAHEQLKIEYASGHDLVARERCVEPREIRVLNGHALVRAYCTTRRDWRTFRVDRIVRILAKSPVTEVRPPDPVANWLTQVGDEGDEVVVVVEPYRRWLFEPIPNARWAVLDDGRHAVRFRLSDEAFLDHLMLQAGDGAVVATAKYAKAGHALARRIADRL
ncbi:MAG: WYL domain-containing protein [Acidobacteriota bacterium]|nr:WYL domain-containing protein [Acidobacteriota bacterium]